MPSSMTSRPRGARRGLRVLPVWLLLPLALGGCSTTAYDRGRSALRAQDYETAVSQFDSSLEVGENLFRATRDRGAARLRMGDISGALGDLEEARRIESDDADLQWLLGDAFAQAARPAEAADAFRAYELLSPRRSVRKVVRQRVAQLEREVPVAAAANLATSRANGVAAAPNTVAVYAFTPQAGENAPEQDQKICRALNIWVSTDLAKVSAVRPVASDELEILFKEQSFTYDQRQFFDPSTLVVAGNLHPARHMVRGLYGSLAEQEIVMGAACYDAEIEDSSQCSLRDGAQSELFDMETQLVFDILAAMDVTPTAEERRAIGEKPTRDLTAFLAFADGVYFRDKGDYEAATAAFEKAAAIDPGFGMAAKEAAASTVMAAPGMTIVVPPPSALNAAGERATTSALQLGLGLIPDSDEGDATTADTQDIVTARGVANIRIRVEIDQ